MIMNSITDTIVAIVPALNEEHSIADVVVSLRRMGIDQVRVVDNGSTDKTAEIARSHGASVCHERRRGYGAACWRGLMDLPSQTEWILFCDADGSDDFYQLPRFFDAARTNDFILGARERVSEGKSGVTTAQRIGNKLATTLMRWGWGFQYRDMGPFRLIRRSAIERLRMEDRTWGWTLEMQVRAVEERLRIVEILVPSLPRQGGRSKIGGSVIGGIRAGAKILATIGKLYWRSHQQPTGEETYENDRSSARVGHDSVRPAPVRVD